MRRIPRWMLFAAFVVVLVLAAGGSLLVATVRRPFPTVDGQLRIAGLTAPVEVIRDANGIPNIYADDAEDLFEAQGYVAAQDRFFEMDVRRHITAGRLSELFGASQVPTDSYIRTLGWRRAATAELAVLSPSTRRYLDAYAAGVNAYIRNNAASDMSLEYSLLRLTGLDYTPEDWTAVDSLSWLKAMSWDLDVNSDEETARALITAKLGATRAADLYPAQNLSSYLPIMTAGTVRDGTFRLTAGTAQGRPAPAVRGDGAGGPEPVTGSAGERGIDNGLTTAQLRAAVPALESAAKAWQDLPAVLGKGGSDAGIGSNSWVVSGSRTTTGKPFLGNDPHLDASIPSIFTQVGLHCRRLSSSCPFDVAGYSFSGMPGVIIGHNQAISWGFTDSYPDVEDLYLEQIRGNTVRVGDRYRPLQVRTEQILVKGERTPRTITIRTSRHGPLLSDVDPQLAGVGRAGRPPDRGYAVALQWGALTPGRTMDALFGIDSARNFTEFRAAARLLADPSQNMVYADRDGNIGYQLPGRFPLRGKGSGDLPAPGWDTRYDWQGTIPFAALPWELNPTRGYIVTANQTVIGAQYPYKLGADYSYGWRSQQLIDRIGATRRLGPADAEQLFSDDTMRYAGEIVPALLKVKVSDSWVKQGQQTLVGWDYGAATDSAAAAYFSVVFHDLLELTFDDQLPAGELADGGDRWFAVVAKLLTEPDNPWWDDVRTARRETRDDILVAAMTQARKEITALISRDPSGWSWGRIHTVTLKNQTLGQSGIAPIELLLNRGPYPIAGAPAAVNAMSYDDRRPYAVTTGPTMRMLVDWSAVDSSVWINQSGVSGHAFDANYDDQTRLWVAGRMLPFAFTRSAVDATAQHRLTLAPSG